MKMDDQRKSAIFLSKMAERAEHYRETLEAIKSALELTEEERILISMAYKNIIGHAYKYCTEFETCYDREEADGSELEGCTCGDDGNQFTLNTQITINESLDKPLSEICASIDQKFKTARDNAINSMTNEWMNKEQGNLEQQPVINEIVEQQVIFQQGGKVYSDAEIDLLTQGVTNYGRNFVTIKNQLFSDSSRSVGGLKKKWYSPVKKANQQSSSGLPLTTQMTKVLEANARPGGGQE